MSCLSQAGVELTGSKPTRRLWQVHGPDNLKEDDDELSSDNQTPLYGTRRISHSNGEIVGNDNPKCYQVAFDSDVPTSCLGWDQF
jgi:hypothetical protein